MFFLEVIKATMPFFLFLLIDIIGLVLILTYIPKEKLSEKSINMIILTIISFQIFTQNIIPKIHTVIDFDKKLVKTYKTNYICTKNYGSKRVIIETSK